MVYQLSEWKKVDFLFQKSALTLWGDYRRQNPYPAARDPNCTPAENRQVVVSVTFAGGDLVPSIRSYNRR
jgi:hypothetical protein